MTGDARNGPIFDAEAAAWRRLVGLGRERGFVTVAEVNATLPSGEASPEMIEDVLSTLSDHGIEVVDGDEDGAAADRDPPGPPRPSPLRSGAAVPAEESAFREADPALRTERNTSRP